MGILVVILRNRYVRRIRAGKISKFSQHASQFYHDGGKTPGRVDRVKNEDPETKRTLVHSCAHGPQRLLLDFLGPKVVWLGIECPARGIFI